MIDFVDDLFTLDKKWIKSFSALYKKKVNIPFMANTRFNCLDEETIHFLKEANCVLLRLGIESGNDFVRKKLLKKTDIIP